MSRITKTLLLIAILLSTLSIFAQKSIITGKVTDPKTGAPLAGASVRLKGSHAGVTTNNDGVFRIEANRGDVLEISIIGYKTQLVEVGSEKELSIKMEGEATELNQVVLVGTRRAGRVKLETPVPVDVVNVDQASMPTGKMDLTAVLNYAAPSLNYNKQSGSDGADHIDLATLRGWVPTKRWCSSTVSDVTRLHSLPCSEQGDEEIQELILMRFRFLLLIAWRY